MFFLTSITLQHKFDFLYSIIYLENNYLHEESLKTDLQLTRLDEHFSKPLYRLDVLSVLHFAKTPSCEGQIFIPEEFSLLKKKDLFYVKDAMPGYTGVRYNMEKRKYRDISGGISLFIYPKEETIGEKSFFTLIQRNGKELHKGVPYTIKSTSGGIALLKKTLPTKLAL